MVDAGTGGMDGLDGLEQPREAGRGGQGTGQTKVRPAPRVPGMDCSRSLDLLPLLYGECQGLEVPLL